MPNNTRIRYVKSIPGGGRGGDAGRGAGGRAVVPDGACCSTGIFTEYNSPVPHT